MSVVGVIGGGASGLMAAYAAAKCGNEVLLFEKNEKCGKKIYITGKGRCNLTNACTPQEFLENVVSNPKFLISAINQFKPEDTINLFEENGLKLKKERGSRVFPESDKASDVTKCLRNLCEKHNVKFILCENVLKINNLNSTMFNIITSKNNYSPNKVIICTGGLSYPSTGSTGDGYEFAKRFGHTVIEPRQGLCAVRIKNFSRLTKLQGLTLKNVKLKVLYNDKLLNEFFGDMLFTNNGVSGPIALSASSIINRLDLSKVKFLIDLKPAIDEIKFDARLIREFAGNNNKNVYNCMKQILPKSLIDEVLLRAEINLDKKVNSITKDEREKLVNVMKNFSLYISSLTGFDEAIITGGGVDVNEVNPKTMESKLQKGLFFAGEVLDVDAFTGGFNLQIAFSTGYVAGNNIKD